MCNSEGSEAGMRKLVAIAVLLCASALMAATPDGATIETPVFRVDAGEVRLTFTAVAERNQLVTELTASDFRVLRDGAPVDRITGFEPQWSAPLSLVVLTDVSESMQRAFPLERAAHVFI